jgi:hypothetical protein
MKITRKELITEGLGSYTFESEDLEEKITTTARRETEAVFRDYVTEKDSEELEIPDNKVVEIENAVREAVLKSIRIVTS